MQLMKPHLDDGCDEFDQEAGQLEEGGVEVVEVVHDQALDVAAIMILHAAAGRQRPGKPRTFSEHRTWQWQQAARG
jgi:hypothetical protein